MENQLVARGIDESPPYLCNRVELPLLATRTKAMQQSLNILRMTVHCTRPVTADASPFIPL
jgi:hypothetical protein